MVQCRFSRCCDIFLPFWWFFFFWASSRYPNSKFKHINAFQLCWCKSLNLWQNKLKIKMFIVVYSPPLAKSVYAHPLSIRCNPKTWRRKRQAIPAATTTENMARKISICTVHYCVIPSVCTKIKMLMAREVKSSGKSLKNDAFLLVSDCKIAIEMGQRMTHKWTIQTRTHAH